MTGIGGGLFFTPAMGVVGTYFSTKRALAIGIVTTGNSVGGMIYPVLVQQLLPKLGFAWTTRVLGFLNLGMLSIVLVFMRPRMPPRKSGPMVDFSAFKEPTYAFLVAGLCLVMWAVYFTFYYVSTYYVPLAPSFLMLALILYSGSYPPMASKWSVCLSMRQSPSPSSSMVSAYPPD